ncbi:hypothetical protein KHA94_24260 [Bacillus sp. FJAT-49705]|uniref:Uncharacterized protein n=1 Tax=Cytobacillus citreus TaxID=2833586 RepID=A0ABS5NZE3_9BACI|nr:hypothetical protein [Cytobacillus citreus]MBS4193210.1 hypothetical protein [Cytobacillus citreus]
MTLLHLEYATEAREGGKIPYSYRTFCENYGKYAKKYLQVDHKLQVDNITKGSLVVMVTVFGG